MKTLNIETAPRYTPDSKINKNLLFVTLPSITLDNLEEYFENRSVTFSQLHGEPLGLIYLSSYLKSKVGVKSIKMLDFSLGLIDSARFKNVDEYIKVYTDEKNDVVPDIIAININYTPSHQFMVKVSKLFKELFPDVIIIAGGFHATNATHEVLECPSIDFVARGQGEVAFVDFMLAVEADTDPTNIKGIYNLKKILLEKIDISSVKSSLNMPLSSLGLETCTPINNLDDLPFPDRTIIDMKAYSVEQGRTTSLETTFSKKKASIITTRGCYFACTFCASRTIFPRKMQYRSTENVIDEIRELHKNYQINFLVLEDDLFTGNNESCLHILRAIYKLKITEIPDLEIQFPNDLNINTTSEEIFDAMIDCGLRVAHIAVESGSEFTQHSIINKRAKIDKVKPYVRYLQKKGVVVKCVYIIGFPGETVELMHETINFAKDVKSDWAIFNIATPLLGTPMYDQFIEMGYIKRDIDFISKVDFRSRHFDTNEISALAINDLQYAANLDVNFINNVNITSGNFEVAEKIFSEISTKYPHHLFSHYCLAISLKKQNKIEGFLEIQKLVASLTNNSASIKMFEKYSYMIPNFLQDMELDNWMPKIKVSKNLASEKLTIF